MKHYFIVFVKVVVRSLLSVFRKPISVSDIPMPPSEEAMEWHLPITALLGSSPDLTGEDPTWYVVESQFSGLAYFVTHGVQGQDLVCLDKMSTASSKKAIQEVRKRLDISPSIEIVLVCCYMDSKDQDCVLAESRYPVGTEPIVSALKAGYLKVREVK